MLVKFFAAFNKQPTSLSSYTCHTNQVTESLLEWFHRNKRDLPWRKNRTPYRVWLSEVMLQQTQVKTVIPYYERWLNIFPNVQDLAEAPLDDVLKQWEGLGYYRRARNLHRAAQLVAFERDGVFPDSYEAWLELPGVGPYAAAAISSILNSESVVSVDGNVKRVAARLFLIEDVPGAKDVRVRLTPYLPAENPGDFNEALMELGATICTKRKPMCTFCPVQAVCQAYAAGRTGELPVMAKRKVRPHYERYAILHIKENSLWLRRRGEDEMLNGLWGFVLVDEEPRGKQLAKVKHAYTHFSLEVTPVLTNAPEDAEGEFVKLKNVNDLALSTLDRKILERLSRVHQFEHL